MCILTVSLTVSLYKVKFRRHTLVEYGNRDRRHFRIESEECLREDICFMFHPCYITFSAEQKEAVFAGDNSIDYVSPLAPSDIGEVTAEL